MMTATRPAEQREVCLRAPHGLQSLKADKAAPMKLPRLGRRNPAETALVEVDRLRAQHVKLDGRLAAALARVEAAQSARRQALIDGDPDVAAMGKLDKACADAAEARAGVEEAMRHVAGQLAEAGGAHQALVEEAKRAEIMEACLARADAIDAAAEALASAAAALDEARRDFVAAVVEHGIESSPYGIPQTAELTAGPVIAQALREAQGIRLEPRFFGDTVPSNSVVVEARRAQSGLLRDHVDELKAGTAAVREPGRPALSQVVKARTPVSERRVILKHGIEFTGWGGRAVQLLEGEVSLPTPLAAHLLAKGVGFQPGTTEAREVLVEQQKRRAEATLGPNAPKRGEFKLFEPVDFDLEHWLEDQQRLDAIEVG